MLRNAVAEVMGEMVIVPKISTNSALHIGSLHGAGEGVGIGDGSEDSATYLFELLVAARRLAVTRRHKFLAYLIGMAAEEARLLTQGRSSVRQKAA